MTDSRPSVRELLAHTADDGRFMAPGNIRTARVRDAIRALLFQRSKSCLRALENGHSGVDFILYRVNGQYEHDPAAPVSLREQARPWNGHPPDPDNYSDGVARVRRVDFRPHSTPVLQKQIKSDIDDYGYER